MLLGTPTRSSAGATSPSNWSQIQGDLVQHIELSLIAVAIGTVISIPLAVLAWRYRIIRTPVFGSGQLPLHHPLARPVRHPRARSPASYSLHDGGDRPRRLHAAHPHLEHGGRSRCGPRRCPRGGDRARATRATAALVKVDLPLALPYIFAGLRVATATVIGLVTVTALIGLGGLGQQITYGFNADYNTPIIVGLVLSDRLGRRGRPPPGRGPERLLVPWARSGRSATGGRLTCPSSPTSSAGSPPRPTGPAPRASRRCSGTSSSSRWPWS